MRSKLPLAVLVAAILIAATSAVEQRRNPPLDRVERAIAAPFTDVGIPPVAIALDFWQERVDGDASDYLSRTRLATAIMADARESGDLSRYADAEGVAREALSLNPVGDEALLALSSARAADHDFATAVELAERVLARNPASTAAKVAIADANFELGNYPAARRQLAGLTATLPDGAGLDSRLAKQADLEGRHDDAIAYAANAVLAASDLDLRPSDAAFYRFQLAHFLYRAGRLDDALSAVDAGIAIDPSHLPSRELRGQVLISLGRLEDAAALYEDLLQSTPAPDLHGALAKVYRALDRDSDADAQIAIGLKLGRELLGVFPAERRHLAGFFADVEPATALSAAEADFETRQDIGAYDTLAWALYRNGRYREAHRYVAGALAEGTQEALLLYHAGMIEAAVGMDARAIELLTAALHLNSHFDLEGAPLARSTLRDLRE